MKKQIIIILILWIIVLMLSANPVSYSQANQIAQTFLYINSNQNLTIENQKSISDSKQKLAYVFQLKPAGFIAVSADDNVYPVIAYSFRNKLIFDEKNTIYYMLKEDIKNRIKYNPNNIVEKNRTIWNNFATHKDRDYFQQWPAPNSTSTGGWVETAWHQSGIYNAFCPLDDNGQRSVVGCVATAMAMIIDFHKSIGNAQFTNSDDYWSYNHTPFKIDDDHQERDFPSFPELNSYLNELRSHYQNNIELTNQDKAALSFACGVSVEMSYGYDGSGSYTQYVADALRYKFGFTSANYMSNYGSSFYNQLKNNMKAMKPAELGIRWADGSHGHAIIADGYNTDEYYHLNYGWGTSDNSCWYLLPNGMPNNYSVISGAVLNIEGGDIPVQVTGTIDIQGESSEGIYITLDGPRFYEAFVLDNSCSFEIPAVEAGTYTATAIKNNRLYYDSFVVDISLTNNVINFNMGNYEALTGTVTSPIDPNGAKIALYQNYDMVYSGECNNSNGTFSIPDVLPGTYIATASLGSNYFDIKEIEVTLENQTVNFNLQSYNGNFAMGYHNSPTEKWSLAPNYTISCGIRLTEQEIEEHSDEPLAKISFIAPCSSEEADISVQLWEDNVLLSENTVEDFEEGEWITQNLDRFIILNPGKIYYAAYKITSQTGEMAFADQGPRVENKGAFFHTTGWTNIPTTILNKNFCIEAIFISQNFATISGTISTADNSQPLEKAIVTTQNNYLAHANQNGNYILYLPEGTYDLTASLIEHQSQTINSISITNGSSLNDINFELEYQADAHDNVIEINNLKISAYPNPFVNSSKDNTIKFNISEDYKIIGNHRLKLIIYNLKGEKIKAINISDNTKVTWNLTTSNNKKVSSGIYFYRIKSQDFISSIQKLTIIK